MSDPFWIALITFGLIYLFIGILVAAHILSKGYVTSLFWYRYQLGWPYYLVQIPAWKREHDRINFKRMQWVKQLEAEKKAKEFKQNS